MAIKATSKKSAAKKPVKSVAKPKKISQAKSRVTAKKTDLPTAAVMRLAKANGAERVGADGAASILAFAEEYIAKLVREATKIASDAGRKTLKGEDVESASQTI